MIENEFETNVGCLDSENILQGVKEGFTIISNAKLGDQLTELKDSRQMDNGNIYYMFTGQKEVDTRQSTRS